MFDKTDDDNEIALFEVRGITNEKGKREPRKHIQWLFGKTSNIPYSALQFDIIEFKKQHNSMTIRYNYMMYGTQTLQPDF